MGVSWNEWGQQQALREACAGCEDVRDQVPVVEIQHEEADQRERARSQAQAQEHPAAHFAQAQALQAALLPPNAAQGAQAHQGDLECRRARQMGQGRPAERQKQRERAATRQTTA